MASLNSLPYLLAIEVVPEGMHDGVFQTGACHVKLTHSGCASVTSSSILLWIRCVTKDRQKFLITKFFSKLQ